MAQMVKNLPAMQETQVRSLGQEDPLEKGMAAHFSILAWRIAGTEEPGGLQSMGLQRVRQLKLFNTQASQCRMVQEMWVQSLGRSPGEGNGNPLQ